MSEFSMLSDNVTEETDLNSVRLSVQLSPHARKIVKQHKEETGIADVQMVARVLEWYASQDRAIRREIMDKNGDAAAAIAARRLAEMGVAGQIDPKKVNAGMTSIPQAVGLIQVMLAQIEMIDAGHREALVTAAGAKRQKGG